MLKTIKNLKECSAESEMWKQKYRILKNEFFELKTKFFLIRKMLKNFLNKKKIFWSQEWLK